MSIEKLREVSEELGAAKKKLQEFAKESGRAAIGAALRPCFEPPTNLKRIVWTQYTPHFNDGDACVFEVNEPRLITERDGKEDEHDLYWLTAKQESKYRTEALQAIGETSAAAFLNVWLKLDHDILEAVFGDGYEITVTKDEVTVEEYDHD